MSSPELGTAESPPTPAKKGSFAADAAKLVTGTTFAQVLALLAAPFLTRIFVPDSFGVAAVFNSIVGVLGVIASLRFELTIPLPERDSEAANMLAVSLLTVTVTSLIAGFTIWLGRDLLVRWLNTPALASYMWLLPIDLLGTGFFVVLSYWSIRKQRYGQLSSVRVTNSVVTTTIQVGAGVTGNASAGALVGGNVVGQALAAGGLAVQIWRQDRQGLMSAVRLPEMMRGLRRYSKFPVYSTSSALLNSLSWQLPSFLLARFFSTIIVGYYALALRVMMTPMNLVGSAIAQVFFQRAAGARSERTLPALVENVFRKLVIIGVFPLMLVAFIGPELFATLLGPAWRPAGYFAQILSPFMFANFVAAPLGQLYSVLEKQEAALFVNIILFATRFASLWWGGLLGDATLGLVLFSASGVVVYGGYSLWISRVAGVTAWSWIATVTRGASVAFGFLIVAWGLCTSLALSAWPLLFVYALISVGYYMLVIWREPELRKMIVRR